MSCVLIKKVDDRFTYYLGKDGRWEGLINNAVIYSSKDEMFEAIITFNLGNKLDTLYSQEIENN